MSGSEKLVLYREEWKKLKALQSQTRGMLNKVESAKSGEFLKRIDDFVRFVRKQPKDYNPILIDELATQYDAFKSNSSFTGRSLYALICALWERPTSEAIPILLKILEEDPTAPREEIIQILMQVEDAQAVAPLLNLLKTLNDENDEYGHLRAAIVEALGAIGDRRALPALRQLEQITSPDAPKLTRYAKWAIAQLMDADTSDLTPSPHTVE